MKLLLPENNLVLAHLIRTGQYIEDLPVTKIVDMTDAISMNYQRMRELSGSYNWKKLIYQVEESRLRRYELETVRKFDRVWLTSQADSNYLDPSQNCPIDVIPCGADLEILPFRPLAESANAIVFIGNMVTLQNQDACHYFIQKILPKVRTQAKVVFRIVGSASETVKRQFSKYPDVEMTGRIEHIQDGVQGAFCGVCPVRAGAGIQTKILEYLALGLPCVTSTVGIGGVAAQAGTDLLVFRDPDEAASQILMLYSNVDLRKKIAAAGRDLVCKKYDWKRVEEEFLVSSMKVSEQVPDRT
jgi:glycosyltransferase involved in cell wall biosynthesis